MKNRTLIILIVELLAMCNCWPAEPASHDPIRCLKDNAFMMLFRWNGPRTKPPPEAALRTADFLQGTSTLPTNEFPFAMQTFLLDAAQAQCIRSNVSSIAIITKFQREGPSVHAQGYVLEIRCPHATNYSLLKEIKVSLKTLDLTTDCLQQDQQNTFKRIEQLLIKVATKGRTDHR